MYAVLHLPNFVAQVTTIYAELEVVSSEFREAERALMNVTSAVGIFTE
jgi:hypothetical protein